MATADIARALGIRYQHAYKVLRDAGASSVKPIASKSVPTRKPDLQVAILLEAGFISAGRWILSGERELVLERPLPKDVGVYAFASAGVVQYVGVATMASPSASTSTDAPELLKGPA